MNPTRQRQQLDRYLESRGLLNYQTKGLSQQEVSNRYANAGVSVQDKWFQQNYGNRPKKPPAPKPTPTPAPTPAAAQNVVTQNQPSWLQTSSSQPAWIQGLNQLQQPQQHGVIPAALDQWMGSRIDKAWDWTANAHNYWFPKPSLGYYAIPLIGAFMDFSRWMQENE